MDRRGDGCAGFSPSPVTINGLSITDPVVEKPILLHPDGFSTELQRPILCISLSEKFASQNACYKLIAGVIETA